jgi:hypothetical protein
MFSEVRMRRKKAMLREVRLKKALKMSKEVKKRE